MSCRARIPYYFSVLHDTSVRIALAGRTGAGPNAPFEALASFDISENIELSSRREDRIIQRLHLHVSVPDVEQAVSFYSTLFNAPPSVLKDDYAKWMLDDPRVNLAISSRSRAVGVDHVGLQVDSRDELSALSSRLKSAGEVTFDQEATTCCYAKSDKSWVTDPAAVRWETFFTHGEATAYGEDVIPDAAGACCAPPTAAKTACC